MIRSPGVCVGGGGGVKPPKRGSGAPEAEHVLMIIKTFLADFFLIKSGLYSIIRTLDFFTPAFKIKLNLYLKAGLKISTD